MVNSYESMYVLRPDLSEEQVDRVVQKYIEFITERGATNIKIQNRGKRRLAYEIQNFQDGIYIQMNYSGDGQFIKPMERDMRLCEEVIRYLNLKLETDALEEDPEEDSVSSDREQPPQEQSIDEQPPQEQPA
ncbi:MAG: 30S ribosomal protein S6 [Prochloraceae cyanobacterium]